MDCILSNQLFDSSPLERIVQHILTQLSQQEVRLIAFEQIAKSVSNFEHRLRALEEISSIKFVTPSSDNLSSSSGFKHISPHDSPPPSALKQNAPCECEIASMLPVIRSTPEARLECSEPINVIQDRHISVECTPLLWATDCDSGPAFVASYATQHVETATVVG